MAWQGAAISAVAGMVGRSNQTEQNIRLMASASRRYGKKYGFNPLTLLGVAGAGVDQNAGQAPLASLQILGEAIGDEFSQDAKDRREHNRLTNELLTLEVQKARTLQGVAPTSAVAGTGGGAPAFNGGRTTTIGNVRRDPTVFGPRVAGLGDIIPDQRFSDAERIEERYGDAVSWGYGALVGIADLGKTIGTNLATEDWSPIQSPAFEVAGHTDDGKPFWHRLDGKGIQFTKPTPEEVLAFKARNQ